MLRLIHWLLLASPLLFAGTTNAQNVPHLQQLSPTAFAWIASDDSSSNGALFVGQDAALLVDPGATPALARAFFAAAEKQSRVPIQHVLLTHWHPDHVLGLAADMGREFNLISHPATRRKLAEIGHRLVASLGPEPDLAVHRLLANQVISERQEIDLGGLTLEVFCPGPAHTNGDLVVWSPSDRVLVTGDLFLRDSCPDLGGGSVPNLIRALHELEALAPAKVLPGHFAVSGLEEMARFRAYIESLQTQMQTALAAGLSAESAQQQFKPGVFSSFQQFPKYRATFADNALAVALELQLKAPERGVMGGFVQKKVLEVGFNPHQIRFSHDGQLAYIAVAGSDQVARVQTTDFEILDPWPASDTPLGVVEAWDQTSLFVAHFGANAITRQDIQSGKILASLETGAGPSLFSGPYPTSHDPRRTRLLYVAERADRLSVLDAQSFELINSYPTGKRPFPPAATSDGRLAFVPNYDDGSVTVVDLWNDKVRGTTQVGEHPSGGVVLPGDIDYAVAVRGQNEVAFINTASHQVMDRLRNGIGEGPFSVVLSPDGAWAFVNNTSSHDVSAIRLSDRKVVARLPSGELPICMAVHPDGKTLWVSCEGSNQLNVFEIPQQQVSPAPAPTQKTQVLVLGMIHGRFRQSKTWGTTQLRETIERIAPDAVLTEIAPNRWPWIWKGWSETGVIEEPRVKLFPEYVDVLLPLQLEMGFTIEPTAGWNQEMSDLRQASMASFKQQGLDAEYLARSAEVETDEYQRVTNSDDPLVIHSALYDSLTRSDLEVYDDYLNDWIGPGGWSNINKAHMAGIKEALARHVGERVLITYGAGHKYWILDALSKMPGVQVLDIRPFLPGGASPK